MNFSSGDVIALAVGLGGICWGVFVWWDNGQLRRKQYDHDQIKRITQQYDSLDIIQGKIKELHESTETVSFSHYALRDAFLTHEAACNERQIYVKDNLDSIKRILEKGHGS